MLRTCPQCAHSRPVAVPELFNLGRSAGPEEMAAAKTWQELQKERAEVEQRLVEQNDPFYILPQYFPWCARYTVDDNRLAVLRAALREGDESTLSAAQKEGLEFAIDFARGDIRRAFALCLRKNPQGQCKGFDPATKEVTP